MMLIMKKLYMATLISEIIINRIGGQIVLITRQQLKYLVIPTGHMGLKIALINN